MEKELICSDDFAKLSRYRSMIYNLFSRVFARKVDREFLESLMSREIIDIVSGVCENEESSGKLTKTIRNILSNSDKFFEVEREFEGLFVVPVNDRFIPPYISYYLGNKSERINLEDGKGVDEGGVALVNKLELLYKKINFTLRDASEVSLKRPDHISYILGFMAALVGLEERYQPGQVKKQLPFKEVVSNEFSFFNEFIKNWVNLFADEVAERANSPFYVEMARLMQSFTSSEQSDLEMLLLQN